MMNIITFVNSKTIVKLIFIVFCICYSINNNKIFATETTNKEQQNKSLQSSDLNFKKTSQKIRQDNIVMIEIDNQEKKLKITKTKHKIWKLEFTEKIFEMQVLFTWMIFIMVFIMVFIGIVLSIVQMAKSQNTKETNFKIGKDGIEVSSSVIGLIVLVLSFAFFYFCINNVYPINQLESAENNIKIE